MTTWSIPASSPSVTAPGCTSNGYVKKVKLPEKSETIEQFVGSRAHDALEWLYREVDRAVRRRWNNSDTAPHGLGRAVARRIVMPGEKRPPEEHRQEVER